jgi:hypothetical protein
MMETTLVSMSLEEELQALQKALSSGSTFTCHGKPTKGTQCGNPLSKPTKTKLDALIRRIIELLKNAGEGIEKLLEELSSLVMCVRYHQGQAPDKCNAWVKRIPVSKCTDLQEEGGKSHVSFSKSKQAFSNLSLATRIALSNVERGCSKHGRIIGASLR